MTINKPNILLTSLTALLLTCGVLTAQADTVERKGPLKDLPSEPKGEHLEKIKALGDNEWVNLGSPEPDPEWGKAMGRSWAPRMDVTWFYNTCVKKG